MEPYAPLNQNLHYKTLISNEKAHTRFPSGRQNLSRKELESKLDKMLAHELYTRSKTADTVEERERARQQYLDKVGMHKDFRW